MVYVKCAWCDGRFDIQKPDQGADFDVGADHYHRGCKPAADHAKRMKQKEADAEAWRSRPVEKMEDGEIVAVHRLGIHEGRFDCPECGSTWRFSDKAMGCCGKSIDIAPERRKDPRVKRYRGWDSMWPLAAAQVLMGRSR